MAKKKTKKKAAKKKAAKKTTKKVTKKVSKKAPKNKTVKLGVDPYPPVDVCCGGTIPLNQSYVPFVNSTGAYQTISNCALFRGVAVRVAPTSGTPYNVPITISPPPTAGDYSFGSTCNCPDGGMPVIKVQ